jgi:DNA-binding LacI/PurR family transcriptional regulator
MSRPTLDDVARIAGVSAKTVSNALLGRGGVSVATRERVRVAADSVGYVANRAGRGLASGRTGRIAVVVPNLYQPYFAEVAERLILELSLRGYTSTLRVAHDASAEVDAVAGRTTRDADGVVVCPHGLGGDLLRDVPINRPVVQLGSGPTGFLDCVVMGEYAGLKAVTRHLVTTGRRRIALVWNGPSGRAPSGDRFAGYAAALTEAGIAVDPELFAFGSDWDRRASGYEAMIGLLRTKVHFDAVVCFNDALAVGVLRALRSQGVRVPQDVAVTGFDDTDEAQYTVPPLTSASPEQAEMVSAAVDMLEQRLGGYSGPPREVHTGAHLVVRDSSTPPGALDR